MQNYPLIYDADEWIDGLMGGGNGGFLTIRESPEAEAQA